MIETIVSMPAVALSLFVIGVICGAVVASIVLPSRREVERLTAELAEMKTEHASYKGHVSKHFQKTSELVANMTASYKAVYDHLASGAQSLCSDTEALEAPKFGSPKLIFDPTVEVAPKRATATESSTDIDEDSDESDLETSVAEADGTDPTAKPEPARAETESEWRLDSSTKTAETTETGTESERDTEAGDAPAREPV